MKIPLQPPSVRKTNAKLIAVVVILALPSFFWTSAIDLRHTPTSLLIVVWVGTYATIGLVISVVRKRMNRHNPGSEAQDVGHHED